MPVPAKIHALLSSAAPGFYGPSYPVRPEKVPLASCRLHFSICANRRLRLDLGRVLARLVGFWTAGSPLVETTGLRRPTRWRRRHSNQKPAPRLGGTADGVNWDQLVNLASRLSKSRAR